MKIGWFVRGDIDGFFGLFVDNLLQLMLIAVLCGTYAACRRNLFTAGYFPARRFRYFLATCSTRGSKKAGYQDRTDRCYRLAIRH